MRSKKFYLKISLTIAATALFVVGVFGLTERLATSLEPTIISIPASCPHETNISHVDSALVAEIVSSSIVRNRLPRETAFSILNSTVRISTGTNRGTGVIIWSGTASPQEYYTYVITNRHVVGTASTVTIEKFNYLNNQTIGETISYSGKILARSSSRDLALIEIRSPHPIGEVAHFITLEDFEKVSIYDPIFISGCSLGNTPAITNGNISSITTDRHLVTGFAIFGNSGGGVFTLSGKIFGIVVQVTGVRVSNTLTIPEPNLTRVISSFVVCRWIASGPYKFIFGEGSFEEFLENKRAQDAQRFFRKK